MPSEVRHLQAVHGWISPLPVLLSRDQGGDIMKQVSLTQFRAMSAKEIREGPCLEAVADGEHIAYIIIGAEQEMRREIIGRASMIDAARGK